MSVIRSRFLLSGDLGHSLCSSNGERFFGCSRKASMSYRSRKIEEFCVRCLAQRRRRRVLLSGDPEAYRDFMYGDSATAFCRIRGRGLDNGSLRGLEHEDMLNSQGSGDFDEVDEKGISIDDILNKDKNVSDGSSNSSLTNRLLASALNSNDSVKHLACEEISGGSREADHKWELEEVCENDVLVKETKEVTSLDQDMIQLRQSVQDKQISISGNARDDDLVLGDEADILKPRHEGVKEFDAVYPRNGKQLFKRSHILAKQVISMHTALSIGFASQLWVDTDSWVVLVVEVRPSLLSGEIEHFLLKDVCQVGDVILVQDETVMEKRLKMIGLETLVGYDVVTENYRNIGKVRGYTFNIDSGFVESLELDSFGISVIPASLVNTYCLLVEDVLEVTSDTVVVENAATSRLQRLTKGLWDTKTVQKMSFEDERESFYSELLSKRRRRNLKSGKLSRSQRSPSKSQENGDSDLPIDY